MFIHDEKLPITPGTIAPNPALFALILPILPHLVGTAASLMCIRHTMPRPDARALVACAATDALNQFELLLWVTNQLARNASADEMSNACYIRHTAGPAMDALNPLCSGDPVTDIHLSIARAQHARTMCDNALRLIDDPATGSALHYVRQRQIDAASSLGAILNEIDEPYDYNHAFDVCALNE